MHRAMMSQGCTSDLERCSNPSQNIVSIGRVAAVVSAAALPVSVIRIFFVAMMLLLLSESSSLASVKVSGINDWLADAATRSLAAVCEHMPQDTPNKTKEKLLRIVAERLLTGYTIESITFDSADSVLVSLKPSPKATTPIWGVSITPPTLSSPVDEWFTADSEGIAERLAAELKGVPVEALSWGDVELRRLVSDVCAERLPGWRTSVMVRSQADGRIDLEVSFTPRQPLTLAVTSDISSVTIPLTLYSRLKDDLLKGYAPVIGIPTLWLERHSHELTELTKSILADESLVKSGKIDIGVKASVGSVSEIDIELESRRYTAWIWMAVYGGSIARDAEGGFHFGRRINFFPRWDMELYTEQIIRLNGWNLEPRFGIRWTPWKNIWLGGEWSGGDNLWWARMSIEPRPRKPYVWMRYSEENDINVGAGYRINDYIAIEAHYDSRDDEPWNIRALVNF